MALSWLLAWSKTKMMSLVPRGKMSGQSATVSSITAQNAARSSSNDCSVPRRAWFPFLFCRDGSQEEETEC